MQRVVFSLFSLTLTGLCQTRGNRRRHAELAFPFSDCGQSCATVSPLPCCEGWMSGRVAGGCTTWDVVAADDIKQAAHRAAITAACLSYLT